MKLLRTKAEAAEAAAKFPKPKKFPVSLDEFLLLSLPNKRTEDRMKLYRESIRLSMRHTRCYQGTGGSVIPIEKIPIPSDEEVALVIQRHRATGFNEDQFQHCLISLRHFADWEQKQNQKKRGKAGAAGKWKKQPPEK